MRRRTLHQLTLADMEERSRSLGGTGPGSHGGNDSANERGESCGGADGRRDEDNSSHERCGEGGVGDEGIGDGSSAHSGGGGSSSCDGGGGGSSCSSSCPMAVGRSRSASAQEKEKAQTKHRNRLMNGRVGGRARPVTSMAAARLATSMGAYIAACREQSDGGQVYSIDDPYQAYGLDSARQDYGQYYGQEQRR